ncbi:hypothetical protein J5N58_13785 [Rhizobium cremeum]|uniref:hypothetical protein n=1 Tax=Rhizobium cremeum TaxID=2813827 RepID=UPI0013B038AF|nr:hypothetical protein [Rhizobium cremeum]MCJ7994938.1 hypothetical protein [Rhizobium cremeum]MCJ8000750.1 hypothetical protein [Rhizobium cremeum]
MIAKTFRLPIMIATLVLLAAPAAAEEIWAMTTSEGTCRISFHEDPVADGVFATLQHDDVCPETLKAVSGYSMSNGDNTIMLYTTYSGLEMVGRADKEEPGLYVGMIGESNLRISQLD